MLRTVVLCAVRCVRGASHRLQAVFWSNHTDFMGHYEATRCSAFFSHPLLQSPPPPGCRLASQPSTRSHTTTHPLTHSHSSPNPCTPRHTSIALGFISPSSFYCHCPCVGLPHTLSIQFRHLLIIKVVVLPIWLAVYQGLFRLLLAFSPRRRLSLHCWQQHKRESRAVTVRPCCYRL